ncbi:MAG: ABC transporter substrate-binding protein [Desulfovibrionaceae bacterium]
MTRSPFAATAPLLAALCVLALLAPAPARAEEHMRAPRATRLILQWYPQAQFAGYYVALEKGFYRDEGLAMTILPGGPDRPVNDYLDSGQADFGTMFLSTAVQKRSHGVPLVCVGQIGQRSALMLVTRKNSGIRTVQDLDGKKIALWMGDFQIQPRALFKANHLNVTMVPQTSSMTLFLRGGVDAASAMWYNEYHTLLASGLDEDDIQPFFFHDLGYDFPEDGIYCLEKLWKSEPETCRAVMRASIKGWEWAFGHPEETLDLVMKAMDEAHVAASRVHQRWMLLRMRDVIEGGGVKPPLLDPKAYDQVGQTLLDLGFIRRVPAYDDFFKGGEHADAQ